MYLGFAGVYDGWGIPAYDCAWRRADCDYWAAADGEWIDSVLDFADDEYGCGEIGFFPFSLLLYLKGWMCYGGGNVYKLFQYSTRSEIYYENLVFLAKPISLDLYFEVEHNMFVTCNTMPSLFDIHEKNTK